MEGRSFRAGGQWSQWSEGVGGRAQAASMPLPRCVAEVLV